MRWNEGYHCALSQVAAGKARRDLLYTLKQLRDKPYRRPYSGEQICRLKQLDGVGCVSYDGLRELISTASDEVRWMPGTQHRPEMNGRFVSCWAFPSPPLPLGNATCPAVGEESLQRLACQVYAVVP